MLANFLIFAHPAGHLESRDAEPTPEEPLPAAGHRFGAVLALGLTLAGFRRLLSGAARPGIPCARHQGIRRRRREARAAQSAPQLAGARDSAAATFTTATAFCWPPATGTNWSAIARNTKSSASRIDNACSRLDNRHYPFGAGDRALARRSADAAKISTRRNASLIEHDSNAKLQGFDDLHELAPLVRYRHQPGNPAMRALLARDRNVHTTIDIRLQTAGRRDSKRQRLARRCEQRRAGGDEPADRRRAGAGQRAGARPPAHRLPTNCSTARAMANIRRGRRSSW